MRTYAYSTQDGISWALHTDHVSLCTSSLIYNNAKHTPLTTLVTSYNCKTYPGALNILMLHNKLLANATTSEGFIHCENE